MNPAPRNWFQTDHIVRLVGGLVTLRLELDLWLYGAVGRTALTFLVDTGSAVSILPESVAVDLGLRLGSWPNPLGIRSASGGPLRSRPARGVRYEFDRLPGHAFRTDFAVSPDLKTRFGLLAWRDLALDFDIRTVTLPQLVTITGTTTGRPGTVRFTLRSDRLSDRVG